MRLLEHLFWFLAGIFGAGFLAGACSVVLILGLRFHVPSVITWVCILAVFAGFIHVLKRAIKLI
jgi:hypothetical protein